MGNNVHNIAHGSTTIEDCIMGIQTTRYIDISTPLSIFSIKPVENYIDSQFKLYYQAESGLNRKNIQDSRVHCLLYFVSPYGHG